MNQQVISKPHESANLNDIQSELKQSSFESEIKVLGTMVANPKQISLIEGEINHEHFSNQEHGRIFALLSDKGCLLDDIILKDKFRNITIAGWTGEDCIKYLKNYATDHLNCMHHIKLIQEKYICRNIFNILLQALNFSLAGKDVHEIVDRVEQEIRKLDTRIFPSVISDVKESIHSLEESVSTPSSPAKYPRTKGLSTGFTQLDELLNFINKDDMIVIAGKALSGKTSLAVNLALNIADENSSVAVFSPNLLRDEFAQKMVCKEANISLETIRNEILSESQGLKLKDVCKGLSKKEIYIENSLLSDFDFKSKVKNFCHDKKVKAIIVDSLANTVFAGVDFQQNLKKFLNAIRCVSREHFIPIIFFCDLEESDSANRRPEISDLPEMEFILQNADKVILLHREKKDVTNLIIAKQQYGPTGTVNLKFHEELCRFDNYL